MQVGQLCNTLQALLSLRQHAAVLVPLNHMRAAAVPACPTAAAAASPWLLLPLRCVLGREACCEACLMAPSTNTLRRAAW